jgi:hypothetical protein
MCCWAHGRYRRGGSARTSAVESAAASRLPTDRMRARTHASSLSYAIRRCCDAQVSATAGMAQMPITSRHIWFSDLRANPTRITFGCTHRRTNTFCAHTHGCAGVCVYASRGAAREGMRGGGAARTLKHLPGRTAMRSSPEQRRAAAWLQQVSARPSRVGARRWCGGDSCHGSHAHPHGTKVGNGRSANRR